MVLCHECLSNSSSFTLPDSRELCPTCFFKHYPNKKFNIDDDIKPSGENPIIIYANGGHCEITIIYILYRSQFPKDIIQMIDTNDYQSLCEAFFQWQLRGRIQKNISEWMPAEEKSEKSIVRRKLDMFEDFDTILSIAADSPSDNKILTRRELISLLETR